jgi:uncharacterized surface protein with fasciclin (FAS1) repeats
MNLINLVKFCITLCCCWTAVSSEKTVYEEISTNPDLSKFKEMVNKDPVMKVYLEHKTATVFAPTNEAITKLEAKNLRQEIRDKIASFHVVGLLVKQDLFPYSVSSSLQEAAPLYLSYKEHRPHTNVHEYYQQQQRKDYYVNNAKILSERSFRTKSGNDEQLLYTIDEALEPYIPTTPLPPFALDLIRQPSIYGIDESWGPFYSKISSARQEAIFEKQGNHTFFVPIGDLSRPGDVFDRYVVLGHVIPNNVLFLNVMGKDNYHSAAYDGTVAVELSLINRTMRINPEQRYYIQSNTIRTDPKHNKGVVMSRILRPNIPVKNGVIHLIEKPLMIIDTSITDFLNQESESRLSIFNQLVNRVPEVRAEIGRLDQKTVLAPTDTAFTNLNEGDDNKVDYLMKNVNELTQLLRLHMVLQSVSTDDIRSGAKPEVLSSDGQRSLYFRVVGAEITPRLTVEGGGVNATAIQADIGATNGIIHIIDRVLGMPFQNIYDKLRTDPQLSFSYELGRMGNQNWNDQLMREDRRFTYFVPSNEAWEEFKRENPSEYKQLSEKLHPQQTRQILDRHLVVNQQISSNQLETNFDTIHTVKGMLRVAKGSFGLGNLYIEWEGKRARIVRPDVQAINGVIHVIDQVLMKKRDLSTTSSSTLPILNTTLIIIFIIIAKLY